MDAIDRTVLLGEGNEWQPLVSGISIWLIWTPLRGGRRVGSFSPDSLLGGSGLRWMQASARNWTAEGCWKQAWIASLAWKPWMGRKRFRCFWICPCKDRLIFSLDLKQGEPLGNLACWRAPDAWSIAEEVIEWGVQRLIVLDLCGVGEGKGRGHRGPMPGESSERIGSGS